MYCAQCNGLKSRVALAVGNDLSDDELRLLEKQLKNCEQCRLQYDQLQKSYEALQNQFDSAPVPSLQDSVWPQVSAKIAARHRKNRPTRFNALLPTLTTIACCLALMLVTNNPRSELQPFAPATESIHPVNIQGNHNFTNVNLPDLSDQQWDSSPKQQLEHQMNPYGYELPRLRHDSVNTHQLHSVKF
ncbi:anti-sigma factor family protein [Gimesia sp.]|uniref:anti-sigma factor family protein n=1 Tax=Gimesia sp. TaxID=2024833 RepID=UPI003A90C792